MKKSIILFIFLIGSIFCFAQDQIEYTFSSYYSPKKSDWEYSKSFYEYDEQNFIVRQTGTFWRNDYKFWRNSTRNSRQFNEHGHVKKAVDETDANNGWQAQPPENFEYTYDNDGNPYMVIKSLDLSNHILVRGKQRDTMYDKLPDETLSVRYDHEWLMELPKGLRFNKLGQVIFKKIWYSCRNMHYEFHVEYYPDGKYKGFMSYEVDELTGSKIPYRKVTHIYKNDEHQIDFESSQPIHLDHEHKAISSNQSEIVEIRPKESQSNIQKVHFKLFPNPTSGDIFLKPGIPIETAVMIKIIDNMGREVWNSNTPFFLDEEVRIVTNQLSSGFYTIIVENNTHFGVNRFVKID